MLNPVAPTRLFLTADKARIVGEEDPGARFLLAGEGSEIPAEYRDLFAASTVEPAAAAEEVPTPPADDDDAGEKAAAKAPNKAAEKAANK